MDCNRYIKFGAFRQFALERLGVDYVATGISLACWWQIHVSSFHGMWRLTGHYATLQPTTNGFPQIFRGVDPVKDQSYFLCRVRHQDFEKVLAGD
jgi:tRNA U34 2-thiouridine synthase MnmA/TrmU